jgi:hypothetical protein
MKIDHFEDVAALRRTRDSEPPRIDPGTHLGTSPLPRSGKWLTGGGAYVPVGRLSSAGRLDGAHHSEVFVVENVGLASYRRRRGLSPESSGRAGQAEMARLTRAGEEPRRVRS